MKLKISIGLLAISLAFGLSSCGFLGNKKKSKEEPEVILPKPEPNNRKGKGNSEDNGRKIEDEENKVDDGKTPTDITGQVYIGKYRNPENNAQIVEDQLTFKNSTYLRTQTFYLNGKEVGEPRVTQGYYSINEDILMIYYKVVRVRNEVKRTHKVEKGFYFDAKSHTLKYGDVYYIYQEPKKEEGKKEDEAEKKD